MAEQLVTFTEKPQADFLIAGWRRQWSDGGRVSGGLTRYLVDKLGARKIGEMTGAVTHDCYPFQVAGTHDTFRPLVAYQDGLPHRSMHRENHFYDAGNGLIIFRGEEPWFRIDVFGEAFFQGIKELGIKQTAAVEGVNGPVPPDLERRITCVYSKAEMRDTLDRYGVQFSSYGSDGRRGPTIAMALVSMAHFLHPDVEMFRFGAMAPMYPFATNNNDQVGIIRDHRSYYDIMRRLKSMFKLDIDLSELEQLGRTESDQLSETLERIGTSTARRNSSSTRCGKTTATPPS